MSFNKVQPHSRARMKLRVDERDMNDPDRDMSDDRLDSRLLKRKDSTVFFSGHFGGLVGLIQKTIYKESKRVASEASLFDLIEDLVPWFLQEYGTKPTYGPSIEGNLSAQNWHF
jgi:hypothetical protein